MAQTPDSPDLFAAAPLPVAPLDDAQRLACLRLIRSENVGPATFRTLINHYGGATTAIAALPELARRGGRTIRICPADDAERELDAAMRIGATPLFTIEPGYPASLAILDHAPPMIYTIGNTALLNRPSLAIIGSRLASAAGLNITRQIATAVGEAGIVVVSGLARGIDGAAHEATLATGTVAVVAGGLDVVYPPEHHALQRRIAEHGCLVSERPPGLEPRARDFPRRNRLISGISHAVLVVEAAQRSGSLITARIAAEQGRDVMAIPGHPLDPRAEGTNDLLKKGATLVTAPGDIIEAFRGLRDRHVNLAQHGLEEHEATMMTTPPRSPPKPRSTSTTDLDAARRRILEALGPAPTTADDLARATGVPIQVVQVALLELSLAGRIEQHGAQLISLRDTSQRGEADPET